MILPAIAVRKRQRSASQPSERPQKFACVADSAYATSIQTSSASTRTKARRPLISSRRVQYHYARLRAYIKSKSRGGSNVHRTSATDDSTAVSGPCAPGLADHKLTRVDTTSRWSLRTKCHATRGLPWSTRATVPERLAHPSYDGPATTPPDEQGHSVRKRLSIALLNPLSSSPTVKVKREKRARPSVQSLCRSSASEEKTSAQTDSKATTTRNDSSTPPTSDDSPTGSPGSIRRHAVSTSFTAEQILVLFNQRRDVKGTSTLGDVGQRDFPTIRTVEATAAAKIFFETHFNALLNPDLSPRERRRQELDTKLENMELPSYLRYRIIRAYELNESETLRRMRALTRRDRSSVIVGGYKVIKVLGKGSFGVVRLVKDAATASASTADESREIRRRQNTAVIQKTSHASLRRRDKTFIQASTARSDDKVYAMKVIRKTEMIRNAQEGHIRAERNFLVAAEGSRWIVPLVAAFQDARQLYLVMEYCIGGDFLTLLIRYNTLSESVTKWYIAEMILAIEEAHKMKWIHRDIKPDNFLITADGHLKISDFGLAFDGHWSHDQRYFHRHRHDLLQHLGLEIQGDQEDRTGSEKQHAHGTADQRSEHATPFASNDKLAKSSLERTLDWRDRTQKRRLARSIVGTSQYMAPEVIRGERYDGRCDWWSVGAIMYECLFGQTPFAAEDRQLTKLKILKHRDTLVYPEYDRSKISDDAIDLIRRLLVEKEQRLCSRRYQLNDYIVSKFGGQIRVHWADKGHRNYRGMFVYPDDAEDIKAHPFFDGIPWAIMHRVEPPFRPRVRDLQDTKYFEVDGNISDNDSVTSDEEEREPSPSHPQNQMTPSQTVSTSPGHFHENQQIVPSMAKQLAAENKQCSPMTDRRPADQDSQLSPAEQRSHVGGLHPRCPTPFVSMGSRLNIGCGKIVASAAAGLSGEETTLAPHDLGPASARPGGARIAEQDLILPPGLQVHARLDSGYAEIAESPSKRLVKERRRARDMILRDSRVGKMALSLRKQRTFIGYEYHRVKSISDIVDEEIAIARELDPAILKVDMATIDNGHEMLSVAKQEGKLMRAFGLTRKNSKRPVDVNQVVVA